MFFYFSAKSTNGAPPAGAPLVTRVTNGAFCGGAPLVTWDEQDILDSPPTHSLSPLHSLHSSSKLVSAASSSSPHFHHRFIKIKW